MHLRDGPALTATVTSRYEAMVASGTLVDDARQRRVARALDRLAQAVGARALARKSSALGWLFARKPGAAESPKGLYIYGGVGRGKTMLMDMFFEVAPIREKRRLHFNAFMAEAHDRVQRQRQERKDGNAEDDDPIPPVAQAIAKDARLLCFDEFTVTDIADAMILWRLFRALFAEGVVLVATSNLGPDELYRDGLNRSLFLPFIELLKQRTDIESLDGPTDYRMQKLDRLPVYMTPLGPEADRQMDEAWTAATQGKLAAPEVFKVMGRDVTIPKAVGSAARFTFAELCEQPLGAREYLAIAARFDTIFIDRVPVLDQTLRNPTKRFILLIDTLYDAHKRVVVSADAPPDRLYAGRPGVTEAFEFERTASRLIEMRSAEWLEAWRGAHASPAIPSGSPSALKS